LTPDEQRRVSLRGTQNVDAYELLMRGRQRESFFNPRANEAAVKYYRQAIRLDPGYADAYAHLSVVQGIVATFGNIDAPKELLADALKNAERAVELERALPLGHFALGRILSRPQFADYPRPNPEIRKAISLDPSHADSYPNLAFVSIFSGDAAAALKWVNIGMQINPHYPFWYLFARAMASYLIGEHDAAVRDLEEASRRNPTVFFIRYWLAAALAEASRADEARWEVDEIRGIGHTESREGLLRKSPITFAPYKDKLADGLKKAGFEEPGRAVTPSP
ncbi:MAG: hypothetical protein VW338_18735, partial [Rhodospirillaceae bacterium]